MIHGKYGRVLGMVLAGGKGERLMPLTKYRAKPAVPFAAKYRIIDFKRNKDGMPATVIGVEYDPNRSANIALIQYEDGEKAYIIAPIGIIVCFYLIYELSTLTHLLFAGWIILGLIIYYAYSRKHSIVRK